MNSRRVERRQALELLYEWDQRRKPLDEILSVKRSAGIPARYGDFCLELVGGTIERIEKVDSIIETYSEGWTIERMPVVDRNILRLGVFELLERRDIPVAVTINECVELAKVYGTDDSRRFVNGLLGRVARTVRADETARDRTKER